jgi:hypothetical protein
MPPSARESGDNSSVLPPCLLETWEGLLIQLVIIDAIAQPTLPPNVHAAL